MHNMLLEISRLSQLSSLKAVYVAALKNAGEKILNPMQWVLIDNVARGVSEAMLQCRRSGTTLDAIFDDITELHLKLGDQFVQKFEKYECIVNSPMFSCNLRNFFVVPCVCRQQ